MLSPTEDCDDDNRDPSRPSTDDDGD
eukprot:COSAG06_NODE_33735_length_485_cov_0.746114_1_plen_25_part_10